MIQQLMRLFREEVVHRFKAAPFRVTVLLIAVLAYSITGFMYFEIAKKPDLNWWDALWWSVVTMTTVGYGDLFPETWGGRIFVAIPTMAIGIGLLGFILSVVATVLIEARSNTLKGLAKVRMKNHIVICNYPSDQKVLEVVEQIRSDESTHSAGIILVDGDLEEIPPDLAKKGVHYVRGNPAKADTLERAFIQKAQGALVLAKDPSDARSDHTSLAVLLTIETVQSEVHTVAELLDNTNREFFERTGCDAIVCLSDFTTRFMVQELLDPGVQSVVAQLVSTDYGQQVFLSRVDTDKSMTFDDALTWARGRKAVLLGYVRKLDTEINPSPKTKLQKGDRLVLIAESRPPDYTG